MRDTGRHLPDHGQFGGLNQLILGSPQGLLGPLPISATAFTPKG